MLRLSGPTSEIFETSILGSAKKKSIALNDALIQKYQDDATIALVKGMNFLHIYAQKMSMGTVAGMIDSLKDDIAYWSSEGEFERSASHACPQTNAFLLALFDMLTEQLCLQGGDVTRVSVNEAGLQ